jgi:NAD(P)-dependent dehydrogenase (short-subunit alcohol dehydrogenase family)/acyl carrier protein
MQTARHIGKIVIKMPDDPLELESIPSKPTPGFRADRSYLLVGGLGGLGRSVATWMVENGARNLIFLSRSARDSQENHSFLEELHSQNCQTQLVAGSVSNMNDVQRAINLAPKPVARVIQMSMVLKVRYRTHAELRGHWRNTNHLCAQDVGLSDMTFSDWNKAVEPKVQGTWNLHDATSSSDLDFFILFSSYGGFGGHTGQANYAAANTFLDAFVQYRHRNGLVASVIDVGVMADVGFVARTSGLLERLEKTVMRPVREKELLDTMTLAKERSKPSQTQLHDNGVYENRSQILLGLITNTPISSPQNRVTWRRDMRMTIYYNLDRSEEVSTSNSSEKTSLKSLLAAENLTEDGKTTTIARAIGSAVANFLIKDEDSIPLDKPLESLGMDSLVAMEVRNWIRQQVGVEMSTITIVQSPSLLQLGDEVRQVIADRAK